MAMAEISAALPSAAGTGSRRTAPLWPVVTLLVAAVILQRFAVPIASELGIGLVLGLAVFAWAALQGLVVIEPGRAVLYCLMLAALLLSLYLDSEGFSPFSLMMLVLLYLPFIAIMPATSADFRRLLDFFQKLALVVAASAVLQFAVQFVLDPGWMFPFDRILPAAFFIPDFNRVIPFAGGLVKSTGLWLLEPSHLSQLMALALLIELRHFGRPLVLGSLGLGLILSFAGTGMLLLAVFVPLILLLEGRLGLLIVMGAAAGLVVLLFSDVFPVSYFLGRIDELTNSQASASMRLLGPYWAVVDVFAGRPDRLVFGLGPGMIGDAVWNFDYSVQDSSWLKLLVEYGLLGAIPFALFYGYCLFAATHDRLLAAAALCLVLFLGGFLLAYHVQFLILALFVWPASTRPEADPDDRPQAVSAP